MPLLRSPSELHPAFQPLVHGWITGCEHMGYAILITETRRERAVQEAYYAYGRETYQAVEFLYAKAGVSFPVKQANYRMGEMFVKTKVPPGRSMHQYGLAVDFVPMVGGEPDWKYDGASPADHWDEIAAVAKHLGMLWGGDWRTFKDRPHLEWHPGWKGSAGMLEWSNAHGGAWQVPIPGPEA